MMKDRARLAHYCRKASGSYNPWRELVELVALVVMAAVLFKALAGLG